MTSESFSQFSQDQVEHLVEIVKDLHWMARRYADGRMTYASKLFNDHTNDLLVMGVEIRPTDGSLYATDGMGRQFDGLSDDQARLAAISAAEQNLVAMLDNYIVFNKHVQIRDLPDYLLRAYKKWRELNGFTIPE